MSDINQLPWLDIKNIDTFIGKNKIFSGLSLKLNHENTVILGPNGAGKSTLIKLIAREIYPLVKKESTFKIFNNEKINIWELRSKVGFVYSEIEKRINSNSLVIDIVNSGFYGCFNKSGLDEFLHKEEVLNLLNYLKIEHLPNKIYGGLSDGEKRRVIIARALIRNPKILVFDEITNRLDIGSKYRILKLISDLSNKGYTIILVSHLIETISKNTKRVILMKDRKIFADGDPISILTSKNISRLYDTTLEVIHKNESWQIIPKL